jgi:hypothetical protein
MRTEGSYYLPTLKKPCKGKALNISRGKGAYIDVATRPRQRARSGKLFEPPLRATDARRGRATSSSVRRKRFGLKEVPLRCAAVF